ncbi:MAG: hypothetical protein JXC32_16815 [Anaerolineae bacterium]|nr:hypothetical protein [Anaerolineae bacterium]
MFGNPERLLSVLAEEQRTRWELVPKRDDERLLLRRLRRSQACGAVRESGTDPYRTEVGGHRLVLFLTIFLGLLALGIALALTYGTRASSEPAVTWPVVLIAIIVVLLVVIQIVARANRG